MRKATPKWTQQIAWKSGNKITFSASKNIPKRRPKCIEIDIKIDMETYVKKWSKKVKWGNERWGERFTPLLRMGLPAQAKNPWSSAPPLGFVTNTLPWSIGTDHKLGSVLPSSILTGLAKEA